MAGHLQLKWMYEHSICCGQKLASSKSNPQLDALLDSVAEDLYNAKLKDGHIPVELYKYNADRLMKALWTGLDGNSFAFDDNRNALGQYLQENLHAFSAAKSVYQMRLFTNLMVREDGSLRSFEEFRNKVHNRGFEINNTWLKTEYDTAVAGAEMARQWDEYVKNGVEWLEYSTVGDSHVRPEHATLDGFTAKLTDKIWNTIYPPNGWNCRCNVVPGVPGKADNVTVHPKADFNKDYKISPYFQKNQGRNKQVFDISPKENIYLNKTTGLEINGNKYPDKLTQLEAVKNYNLPSADRILTMNEWPEAAAHPNAEDAIEWFDEVHKSAFVIVKSKTGASVKMTRESFRHATEDKPDEQRWKFTASFEKILKDPDEVWQRRNDKGKKLETTYIKYFDGKAVVVRVDELQQAFTIHQLGTRQEKSLRGGLLIFIKK